MDRLPRPGPDRSGYLSKDTIAAILTPPGGAVSLIRVSGIEALPVLRKLARLRGDETPEPRRLELHTIRDGSGGAIDEALCAYFAAPRSFTGEDCVEIHLHGGTYLAPRVMGLLAELGTRQALPGEFSFRAVRNGKMSLSQAEGLADLIAASNDGAASLALEKMSGSQSRWVGELAEGLRELASLGEVGIDFSDQDVDEVSLSRLKGRIGPIAQKLRELRDSYSRGAMIQEGVRAVFVGLPNAGKSSFFNALLGEDRSIVSEIAGTTRDVIGEKLVLRGAQGSVTLRIEDTAGLRASSDPIEKIGVERTQKAARGADLIVLVLDLSQGETGMVALASEWESLGRPVDRAIGILAKRDLVGGKQVEEARARLGSWGVARWLETSARTGEGVSAAAGAIAEFCGRWTRRERGEVLLTRQDHAEAADQALSHLARASGAPEIDLFASDLKQALYALSPLIGETLPDDILGRIF